MSNVPGPQRWSILTVTWLDLLDGNTPLVVSLRVFPERLNWEDPPWMWWHNFVDWGTWMSEKESLRWASVFSHCFLDAEDMWPAGSGSRHSAVSAMKDCSSNSESKSTLPSFRGFCHSTKKSHSFSLMLGSGGRTREKLPSHAWKWELERASQKGHFSGFRDSARVEEMRGGQARGWHNCGCHHRVKSRPHWPEQETNVGLTLKTTASPLIRKGFCKLAGWLWKVSPGGEGHSSIGKFLAAQGWESAP